MHLYNWHLHLNLNNLSPTSDINPAIKGCYLTQNCLFLDFNRLEQGLNPELTIFMSVPFKSSIKLQF